MSDIKKFTGYVSSDGKTHNSQKAAVTHELELKTKKALADSFGGRSVYSDTDGERLVALDDFLYENRVAILAALNQEVLLRKKRTPKPKAANDIAANQAA